MPAAERSPVQAEDKATIAPRPADLNLPRFWIQPYYKSFNGLRGFAVTLVFISHYAVFWRMKWLANYTWEGVDLFFVLSGFLITGILYDSIEGHGFFRNFYIRRALRIFPIFYGFFLGLLALTPILHLRYNWSILFFVFYVGNLVVPVINLGAHNPTIISILHHGQVIPIANIGHLWSLCVEEQFYLVWPAIVWLVKDRRKLMMLCLALCIATCALRVYLFFHAKQGMLDQSLIFWSTYTRYDTLLVGAWMALWLRGTALSPVQLRRTSSLLFWPSAAVIAIGVMLSHQRGPRGEFFSTIGFTLVALASAGLILRCLDEYNPVAKLFQLRLLGSLGVISYGFYFFHSLFRDLWLMLQTHHPRLSDAIPLFAFASTAFAAWLSFRFFETPFLRLKSVFAPQQAAERNHPAHLHVSVPEVNR